MRKDRIQKLVDFLRGLDEDKFDLDYRDNPHDRDCGGPVSWLPAIFPHLVKWRGSAGLVATAKLEEEWDDPEKEEWLNDMWAETGYADCRNCWDDVTMVLFEIHYDHVVYLFDGGHAADIGVAQPEGGDSADAVASILEQYIQKHSAAAPCSLGVIEPYDG